jgi:hypothetical protein
VTSECCCGAQAGERGADDDYRVRLVGRGHGSECTQLVSRKINDV